MVFDIGSLAIARHNKSGTVGGGGGGGEVTPPRRIRIFMNYLCRMEAGSAQSNMFLFSSRYLP